METKYTKKALMFTKRFLEEEKKRAEKRLNKSVLTDECMSNRAIFSRLSLLVSMIEKAENELEQMNHS